MLRGGGDGGVVPAVGESRSHPVINKKNAMSNTGQPLLMRVITWSNLAVDSRIVCCGDAQQTFLSEHGCQSRRQFPW